MARSSAAGSELSSCSGKPVTPCRAQTARSSMAGSSTPGRPTFTSSICAPASSCAAPSESKYSMFSVLSASLSLGLPVGFIRSPTMTGPAPSSTAVEKELTTVLCFLTGSANGSSRQRFTSAAMCSGVVPQQPPSSCAPASAILAMPSAKSPGERSNTVRPSTDRGRPAFGAAATGMLAAAANRSAMVSISSGPRPQLRPSASTRRPSSSAVTASGVPPVSSRARSSKAAVAITGSSEFSLAASTAAFSS